MTPWSWMPPAPADALHLLMSRFCRCHTPADVSPGQPLASRASNRCASSTTCSGRKYRAPCCLAAPTDRDEQPRERPRCSAPCVAGKDRRLRGVFLGVRRPRRAPRLRGAQGTAVQGALLATAASRDGSGRVACTGRKVSGSGRVACAGRNTGRKPERHACTGRKPGAQRARAPWPSHPGHRTVGNYSR
jgi:hypothetical protein